MNRKQRRKEMSSKKVRARAYREERKFNVDEMLMMNSDRVFVPIKVKQFVDSR